ncbi:MAG: bifunctional (p)ppGpp synthetase/guanosine-3',5'-bis(diphosphate) 3'-pyrophosphohydrolase [Gammaproteobacteria bacterium]|nr:bifunctional (p)ppGpp synthetase/guanosine-3',5'-bis(diphosphate) 3'-pyrophosphohydrolase [Gammaproteobacteria bacterium]
MISKAKKFARHAHETIGQRRKYTDQPYIVHPRAVAKLVSSVTDDEAMICAAWLHDVVEDTVVTIDDIRTEFGEDVATLVDHLSDVSRLEDGNRETRKRIDLEHTKTASARAKTVKLADLIDNTRSIVKFDPGFAKTYMGEKRQLLKVLREGDRRLYAMATEIVEKYYET